MIRFSHVSKRYPGGHDALRSVSFHLRPGSMSFLAGHSGAGKSTLLKLITHSIKATRGEINIDGQNITRIKPRHIPTHRRKIGSVFQDHKLLYDRSVFDNVALPLIVAGATHQETSRRVRAALDKVQLLDKEKSMPITLSGGQQQRVGIARAVVSSPTILLADEPTGNLDPELSDQIMKLFYEFNHHDVTVLIATHDQRYLQDPKTPIVALRDGRLILDANEETEPPQDAEA
ncbi:MAG: cell division transport system ATP-binding protein [Saprospiraceae bacterium]|jgi:cell division transport system ATP-binding protein